MAIKELDGGQMHRFAPTALRVELTGASPGGGVVLKAVDQAGQEAVTVRLTDVEVVLTPEPRRLRLVAVPSTRGSFPAGTSLGLMLRTEGSSAAAEQILVSSVDVGALAMHELAVLEFATDQAILTVSRTDGGNAPTPPPNNRSKEYVSGNGYRHDEAPPARTAPDEQEHTWLQQGRYALREAKKLGTVDSPVTDWGVVLDGSASMCAIYCSGQLEELLRLVCGTYVQWTNSWPSVSTIAGVRVVDVDTASTNPQLLAQTAFDGSEPSSWSSITEATTSALRRIGADAAMLIVTDGVPGDIDRLASLCRENPSVRFTIVTTGVSRQGLVSDGTPNWWEEDLVGLDDFVRLPNCSVAAVRVRSDERLELSGSRAAELALRMTAPMTTGAPA